MTKQTEKKMFKVEMTQTKICLMSLEELKKAYKNEEKEDGWKILGVDGKKCEGFCKKCGRPVFPWVEICFFSNDPRTEDSIWCKECVINEKDKRFVRWDLC